MLSRLFDRSVRWLTASLAIAALVTALAVPVQAAPRSESGESILPLRLVEQVEGWVQTLLAKLRPTDPPTMEEGETRTVTSKAGVCIDPVGNPITCPEDD
jgi:hypothetical protein